MTVGPTGREATWGQRFWLLLGTVVLVLGVTSIASAVVARMWISQADFDGGTFVSTVSVPDEVRLVSEGLGEPDSAIGWWDPVWGQRRCIDVASSAALTEFQLRLVVDTATPIGGGRMDPNGDDLRFIASDGITELDFWIEGPIDSPITVIWVQVDSIPVGSSTICMYYDSPGQPAMSDPLTPFTYSSPVPLYVAVSDSQTGADVAVVSYVDSNTVSDGTTTITLDAGMVGTLPGATHTGATVISTTGPLALRGVGDVRDTYVPLAFAATSFVMPSDRNLQRFSVYAPFADATIDITVGTTLVVSGLVVPTGTTVDLDTDVVVGQSALIESDQPVLATHRTTNNRDAHLGYSATTESVYGAHSTRYMLGFLADGTSVDVVGSDGVNRTHTGNRGDGILQAGGGGQGTGPAVRIDVTAGGPIGAIQQADGDGLESTTFWPASEHNIIYYVPTAAQYAAFVCSDQGTLDVGGPMVACTGVMGAPGKALVGGLAAGTQAKSTAGERFWMYYEDSATGDETNVLGPKQARKTTASPPSVTIGPEESRYEPAGTWTSAAFDTGGSPFYGDISWNPVSQPAGTTLRFQVATAPAITGPFVFVGPDGTPATFFTDPVGTPLDGGYDGERFVQLRAYLDTTNLLVTPVAEDVTLTFELAGDVSGSVFDDLTPPNGVFDSGESGIDGVDVEAYRDDGDGILDPASDTLIATVTTAGGGAYSFAVLQPGSYFVLSVDATVPTGFVTPPSTANPAGPIVLTDGLSVADVDFGYESTGDIAGVVFSDLDADGVHSAEPGLDGVAVELWLDNGDGIFDMATDTLITTQTTGVSGVFYFTELAPDTYFVRADPSTVPPDHDPLATTPNPAGPLVLMGGATQAADIGFQPYTSISGEVFVDVNEDGVPDPGEPPAGSIPVELWQDDGDGVFDVGLDTLIASTTSAADGSYTFADITTASFCVRAGSLAAPYLTTTSPNPIGPLTLIPGDDRTGIDIGLTASVAVTGTVFEDLDADGSQDAGEPGLAGVTIILWRDNGDGLLDPTSDTPTPTPSGTDGSFNITGVHPGIYFVQADPTTLPKGVSGVTVGPNPTGPIAVASLDTLNVLFGFISGATTLPNTGSDLANVAQVAVGLALLSGLLTLTRRRARLMR